MIPDRPDHGETPPGAQAPGASSSINENPRLPDGLELPTGRMLVMGVLNVTPDSFSDGGQWGAPAAAVEHAIEMVAQGADIIDIGGESTRPHSRRITTGEEWARIGPVVETLADRGYVVSVDTLHADTARRAADAGAAIINDVSGGRFDPDMNAAVADTDCAYVIQHFRQLPGDPNEDFDYGDDVTHRLIDETLGQVRDALDAGIHRDRIIIDPGLGFALLPDQAWQILSELPELNKPGYPVLIGPSRKRFLRASTTGDPDVDTVRVVQACAEAGMWAVRVHAIEANARVARIQTAAWGGTNDDE